MVFLVLFGPMAYKLSDSGGLYLAVMPQGGKLWRWKYRFDGKEKLMANLRKIGGPHPTR